MSEFGISLKATSAIDLKLQGTVGSFEVGGSHAQKSLNVKYFLTHVGLDFAAGSDEKMLRELAPVREIFDPKDLDFDEIMQRDIDDSRVSNELIPYILDDKTNDLIKFFPPIVVVVLPISDNRNKPEPYYPKVSNFIEDKEQNGVAKWEVTRSGEIGAEVFEFRQPIISSEAGADNHNLVTLGLNTSKCRMIIVDGQHRAMSLLALYRNLKDQWSDAKRQSFKKYYEEWTPNHIRKFDLKKINLPLIICTIPSLDDSYKEQTYNSGYNLKKAARSIFLTLNKTARKVSRTRNLLLDDNNLISSFMRETLGQIKDSDVRSDKSLAIQNVELDHDKQKLSTPIAISGVSHIYYMIEHLLLDSADITGVSQRSGRFGGRTTFSDALERLDCKDELGSDAYHNTKRDSFNEIVETSLKEIYQRKYGNHIITFLNNFFPYKAHNKATVELYNTLMTRDPDLVSMLYEGQGMINVFESHMKNLKSKVKESYFESEVPKIEAIVKELESTNSRLNLRKQELFNIRAVHFTSQCSDKSKFFFGSDESDKIYANIKRLYDNIFTTVAFQSAAICGFFKVYETVGSEFKGNTDLVLEDVFNEYIDQLNGFFCPKSFASYKRLVSAFLGKVEGSDAKDMTILINSRDSFKSIVYPSEMNPDIWPRYRYIFLELWNPTNIDLQKVTEHELEICRTQVFRELYERRKVSAAQQKSVPEESLSSEDLSGVFNECYEDYRAFLKNFGKQDTISKTQLKQYINSPVNLQEDFEDEYSE